MKIANPQQPFNGVPAENVFIAMDDMGTQVGMGYLVYQNLPHRSPECPVNIYFEINSLESGWYLILGALVARARLLRQNTPELQQVRLYTRLTAQDQELLQRYQSCGFDCSQHEAIMQLYPREGEGRVPMSCEIRATPVNTPAELNALVERLRRNDIQHIDVNYLQQQMRMPHFYALGLIQGQSLAGEIIAAGSDNGAEILAVYIDPIFRRQGLGALLMQRVMAVLSSEGVRLFAAEIVTISQPQCRLAAHFQGVERQQMGLFPQLIL